jgi:hypothetical protein
MNDPSYAEHNREIQEATDHLVNTVAQITARHIMQSVSEAMGQVTRWDGDGEADRKREKEVETNLS